MTDEDRPPPKASHDETVAYRVEVVPGSSIDVERWEWWSYPDAGEVHYYAKGLCPACHAEIQGSYADLAGPIEGQGRRGRPAAPEAIPPEVEIPLRCLCGADHGHAGAGGCGRRWSVMVPRAAP